MRNLFLATVLASLATGCGGNEDIWLFWTDADGESTSTFSIEENYLNWQESEDEVIDNGGWTYSDSSMATGDLAFGQVVKLAGDNDAVLILDGVAMPGIKSGGVWTFRWTDSSDDMYEASHESGYSYTEHDMQSTEIEVTMEIKGGNASGRVKVTSTDMRHWTESDEWDSTLQNSGDTPVSNYLENTDGNFIENAATDVDCAAAMCELMVTSSNETTRNFTAELTRYSDEDAFSGVQYAGN
jgi:hypothetical protein